METIIKNLINLQDCDRRLNDINEKSVEGPARIKLLEDNLKLVTDQVDEKLSKVEAADKERRQLELEIAELDSGIVKSNIKLTIVKSNKEYTAALKEIEDLEREKSVCEEKVLQLMEASESLDEKCSLIKEQKKVSMKEFKENKKKIQKEIDAFDRARKKLEKEKVLIRKEMNEDLLKNYDIIKERKQGIAVASVIMGICQVCHMGIPPQKFNELMRGDVLMSCPHCGRMIYWGEDERFMDDMEAEG